MPQSYSTAQKLLPLLLDSLEDYALFMMDTSGKIVTWTPGVERVLGYTESEFLGQHTALIFTGNDCARGVPGQELETAEREGRSEDRRWHLKKDGNVFWANGQMIALRGDAGELRGFAKILRDDTRHKQIEEDLRETRERLQSALDIGRIGTWQFDVQLNRVWADRNLVSFFGVSEDEARGGPLELYLRAIHPDDLESVNLAISHAIQNCAAFISDYRINKADGSVLWVEARGQVEADANGKPWRLDGVMLDISSRKRAEDASRQSDERYRTLFEAIGNGFCVIEVLFDSSEQPFDYRFLEINPAFEQQTGLRNALGKTALELVPGLDDNWFQIYGRVALTGEPVHFQNPADAMGRWFDVHAFRVGAPELRRVALLFTDITERKQGEEALKQAHAKAEETNRMKDEFLATLSHELRTPLNAILGWANILRTSADQLDEATRTQALETIERNARSQSGLIDDLLDVSRILTGKMRLETAPVELAELVDEAIRTVTPTAQTKQIRIETFAAPGSSLIAGDKVRVGQVLWNLLSNAIKFTPSGGHIEVRSERVASGVRVSVQDSGRGIAPEFLPHVFERFRQADASSTRAYGGLGIGLALVRHLMEAHGGTASADSPGLGLGATFSITFPLSSVRPEQVPTPLPVPRPEAQLSAEDEASLPPLSGLHILVVDDEGDARALVNVALSQRGASVEMASSAREAGAIIEASYQNGRPFDVLVSDIGMPGEDGYSLIRQVRHAENKRGGFLPAVALTAYASHKDRVQALLAGFQVHLAKPVDPLELVATVASLTNRTGHEE